MRMPSYTKITEYVKNQHRNDEQKLAVVACISQLKKYLAILQNVFRVYANRGKL